MQNMSDFNYILSLEILKYFLENKIITNKEFDEINRLNIKKFNPKIPEMY